MPCSSGHIYFRRLTMSLKPTIHFHVSPDTVALKVAREFKPIVDPSRLTEPWYTVIAYPGMRGESQSIVDSKAVAKAISKASAQSEPVVAVAHNFTAEALHHLEAIGALVFCTYSNFWSDESWANVRDHK
jgi:hypothetical protein